MKAYQSVKIGNPLDDRTLMGPLVDDWAVKTYVEAIDTIRKEGGEILCGGNKIDGPGQFVEPTLVKASVDMPITKEETINSPVSSEKELCSLKSPCICASQLFWRPLGGCRLKWMRQGERHSTLPKKNFGAPPLRSGRLPGRLTSSLAPLPLPLLRCGGKRQIKGSRVQGSRDRPRRAKAEAAVAAAGAPVVAEGRPATPGVKVPGAAAGDPPHGPRRLNPGAVITRSVRIVTMPVVLYPFPDVPVHVVQSKFVRILLTHRVQLAS